MSYPYLFNTQTSDKETCNSASIQPLQGSNFDRLHSISPRNAENISDINKVFDNTNVVDIQRDNQNLASYFYASTLIFDGF